MLLDSTGFLWVGAIFNHALGIHFHYDGFGGLNVVLVLEIQRWV